MPEENKAAAAVTMAKKRQSLCDAYRAIFDDPQNVSGRAVMRDLANKFFQMKPAKILVPGDPMATAFVLGQRSVVDYILNQVTLDMEKIIKQMKEQREYE